MISDEHVGQNVCYWTGGKASGQHLGILNKIEGVTAYIKHPVYKREQKVHVNNCEPLGEKGMTIFDELFKAAEKFADFKKQGPEHSDAYYIQTLMRACQRVPGEDWLKLTKTTKDWYNDAANQYKATGNIPPCPGFIGKDDVKKTTATVVPPKGMTATEVFKAPPSRFQTSNINNVPKKRVVTGVMDALRKTVVIHPDWTSRQVFDYLKINGFPNVKLDTISVDGGNIRRTIEIMKEIGWTEPSVIIQNDKKDESQVAAQ